MLDVDVDTIRIFLHVTAACVWIGGQVIVAALLPVLRGLGPEAPGQAARQFARVAWPAFAVLVITGVWNLLAIEVGDRSTEYHMTLGIKMLVVAVAAGATAVHSLTTSPKMRGATGGIGFLASLAALFFGVVLASSW